MTIPRTTESPYDFYRLQKSDQKKMVGISFTAKNRKGTDYFPVKLHTGEFNYGSIYGLIAVSSVAPYFKNKQLRVFGVYALSPDDLDLGFHMVCEEELALKLRKKAMDFLHSVKKLDCRYKSILDDTLEYISKGEANYTMCSY